MDTDKKLYTLLVYSENIAGILNQITAVFTRRQVNIERVSTCRPVVLQEFINIRLQLGVMKNRL